MAVMGFNPAMEMSQIRTQQNLSMQGPAAAGPAPTGAAGAARGMTLAAAAPGAAGEAGIGAAAVQPEPPQTSKILMQGILRGALTGASMALGFKQFGPLLGKIPFIGKVATGAAGFLTKIPLIGGLIGKALPLLGRTGLAGFAIAGLAGAAVGAIFGGISAMRKAKKAAAEYAQAMAQQPPVGDPLVTNPDGSPKDIDPKTSRPVPKGTKKNPVMKKGGKRGKGGTDGHRAKTWIIAHTGVTPAANGVSYGSYEVKKGDTIAELAKRFHTTAAEINKLNPNLEDGVVPGVKLKLRRRVVD